MEVAILVIVAIGVVAYFKRDVIKDFLRGLK